MTLTAEQIAIRRTGIGASEVSALTGTSTNREPIDVWLEKLGRSALSRECEDEGVITTSVVGSTLEDALVVLYNRHTGRRAVRQSVTNRHPDFEHVLASPDAFVDDQHVAGAELKVVGYRMRHHWENDSIPDYVVDQAMQNMAVHGAEAWDVVALIGTEFRVQTIEYDATHAFSLIERCELFWIEHVETEDPPPVSDPELRRAYLRTRYPGSTATKTRDVSDDEAIADVVRWLSVADDMSKLLKTAREELQTMLCGVVGDDYGIAGPWGKFIWYPQRGRVDWEALATELAGGAVPADLIEKHRGKSTRVPRLYPADKTNTTKKTRTKR